MIHTTTEKGNATLDVLEDGRGHRLCINRLGAEMISLQAKDAEGQWHGFLYRDGEVEPPASGWGNHATVMGYFLHRLLGEKTLYRGTPLRGGNHGFLRHFPFEAPDVRDESLIYRVSPDLIPPDAYPLRVGFELSYGFEGDWLRVGFRFENFEDSLPAHVSFGLHPGFAVSSLADCQVHFPPGKYIRHFAPGNFLDGRTEILDFPGGEMPFAKENLPDSYLVELSGVPSPFFTVKDGHRSVTLDFSGVPYMTLWSDGGPFLCVEPCWGLPDSNPQKPFEAKDGIQVLAPRAILETSFRIQIVP